MNFHETDEFKNSPLACSATRFVHKPGEKYYGCDTEDHLETLGDNPPKKRRNIIEEIFPSGEIVGLVGKYGSGKTSVAISLGSLVSSPKLTIPFGENGFIIADIPGRVVFIGNEGDIQTSVSATAKASGADPDDFMIWKYANVKLPRYIGKQPAIRASESKLIKELKSCVGLSLVIFDNVDLIYDGYPNSYNGRIEAMGDYLTLARKNGFCILVLAHFDKGSTKTTNPLNRILRGSALSRMARSIFFIEELAKENPDDRREFAMFDSKPSLDGQRKGLRYCIEKSIVDSADGPIETFKVKWLGRIALDVVEDLLDQSRVLIQSKAPCQEKATEFIRDFLGSGPRLVCDLNKAAKALGIAPKTLEKARKNLMVGSKKISGAGQTSGFICWLPGHECELGDTEPAEVEDEQVRQVEQLPYDKTAKIELKEDKNPE